MKKFACILLSICMLFAISACGTRGSSPGEKHGKGVSKTNEKIETSNAETVSEKTDNVVRTPRSITMATGTANGANYKALVGITNIMSRKWSEYSFTPEVTNGSVENIRMLVNGAAQIACAQADAFYRASRGDGEFDESAIGKLTFVVCGNETVIHMIVRNDGDVNSFYDMKGKKAAVGSGTIAQVFWPMFLDAYGLTEDDIKIKSMNMADCASALRDGQADMFFYCSNFPHPTIQDLVLNGDVRFLDVEPEIRKSLCKANPCVAETIIPADIYELEKDVKTIGTRSAVICTPNLDEQFVYDFLETIFENQDELALLGSTVAAYNPDNALKFSDLIPVHKGAEKYYKERNMM